MIDFKSSLSPSNIDLLIQERGLFIAHTYFSAPMAYHHGKLFSKEGIIDDEVNRNFEYLSQKILSKEVWNPTLKELIDYLKKMRQMVFYCNDEGEVVMDDDFGLFYRMVE